MKKSILLLVAVLGTALAFAQAPDKMSYQSIVRDASGGLLSNQAVAIKISILENSSSGTLAYSERHTLTTNVNGLASVQLGDGTVLFGTFSSINWGSGTYFVKTETDPNGGTNYSISGTQQLLSVPYALNAKTADALSGGSQWTTSGSDILNANTGNIGIGTNLPSEKLAIENGNIIIRKSTINNNSLLGQIKFGTSSYWAGIESWQEGGFDQTSLAFRTAWGVPQTQMFIRHDGNIGIGTNGYGNTQLDVQGYDAYGIYLNNPNASQYGLYVNGTAAKPGGSSWTVASDARLKQNVETYADGLTTLMSIKPVKFKYTKESGFNSENEYVGVLAQDLQEVAPYMVESFNNRNDGKDYLAVDNHAMTYMLINAVQEQQVNAQTQEQRIQELEAQLEEMRAKLEVLLAE